MAKVEEKEVSQVQSQLAQQPLECFSCRSVTCFEKICKIGQGTYGTVYRARDRDSGEIVALKKLRLANEKEGFPLTSIREIKLLKKLNHTNIVRLQEVVVGSKPDSIFLVFEFCEHDLATLLDHMKRPFSESEIKCILLQLLRAVAYLHTHFVLHRDLKLSNLLMNNHGILKLADFGLARLYGHPLQAYTPKVVTLWYRPPEILLGAEKYHTAADCWAVGCIFGELLKHRPLLPGKTDMEQLELIFKLLGTPNDKIWPGYSSLPVSNSLNFPLYKYNNLNAEFPNLSRKGMHLLKGLMTYDPAKRMTAAQALDHPYFQEKPLPQQPEMMPTFPSLSAGLFSVPAPIPTSSSSSSSSSASASMAQPSSSSTSSSSSASSSLSTSNSSSSSSSSSASSVLNRGLNKAGAPVAVVPANKLKRKTVEESKSDAHKFQDPKPSKFPKK